MRIPIVNENDEIVKYKGQEDRSDDEITRVAALWVTDKEGNVLLAQRSLNKKRNPGKWGPAVAGSVEEGETYEDNIIKEAEEEIGLTGVTFVLGPKMRRSSSHEYFLQWFVATVDHNYSFTKQDEEVETLRWFSPKEVYEFMEKQPEMFLNDFKRYTDYFIT